MTHELTMFEPVYERFPQLMEHKICFAREHAETLSLLPVTLLPEAVVTAMVQRWGPGAIYVSPPDRIPPCVSADALANLIIEFCLCRGTALAECPQNSYGRISDPVVWLLHTIRLEQKARDATDATPQVSGPSEDIHEPAPEPESTPSAPHARNRVRITDPVRLATIISEIKTDPREKSRRELLERYAQRPDRLPLKATRKHLRVLDELRIDFPNFGDVLDALLMDLNLLIAERAPLVLPPTLLVGPPGVGKTEFARQVCERLRGCYTPVSVASISSSFVLCGSHRSWSTGATGLLALELLRLDDRQPLFVLLDEIDKIQDTGRNHPVEPVLLELLEPRQNTHFHDEYLDIGLNLTPFVTFIATANRMSTVSAPLRSRLRVIEVPLPTRAQMPAVTRSLDRLLRDARPALRKLFAPLSDAVMAQLEAIAPRELRQVLLECYSQALKRGDPQPRCVIEADVVHALARRPTVPVEVPTQDRADDSVVVVFPIRRSGGGSVPPASTLH